MIRAAAISGALAFGVSAMPVHAESFLSLAMDPDAAVHAFGSGVTVGDAQRQALQKCGEVASSCKVVTTRQNLCISLAFDYSNGGFGVYTAPVAEVAEREAVPHCSSYGNPNCQAVETVCAKQ